MLKGVFAKRCVKLCICVLCIVLIWSLAIKTVSAFTGNIIDVSDVLTYAAAAFGGELLLLCVKRIMDNNTTDINGGKDNGLY